MALRAWHTRGSGGASCLGADEATTNQGSRRGCLKSGQLGQSGWRLLGHKVHRRGGKPGLDKRHRYSLASPIYTALCEHTRRVRVLRPHPTMRHSQPHHFLQ
jgi:hypothetical protein